MRLRNAQLRQKEQELELRYVKNLSGSQRRLNIVVLASVCFLIHNDTNRSWVKRMESSLSDQTKM